MRVLIVIISFVLNSQCYADEGFYLSGGLGKSEFEIKPDFNINNISENYDNYTLQALIGRQFNNIQLDIGYAHHGHFGLDFFTLTDTIEVSEYMVLIGYHLGISESIKIIPRIGFSRWHFKSKEGWFLNPGAEKQYSENGNNQTYMLSVFVNSFYITYQSADYDFGSLASLIIGIEIGL